MKRVTRRRKCQHCKKLFTPDPRSRDRQLFCSEPACKKASKARRQERWRSKPENRDYWRGSEEVDRVRAWRKANPGYWRRESRRKSYVTRRHGTLPRRLIFKDKYFPAYGREVLETNANIILRDGACASAQKRARQVSARCMTRAATERWLKFAAVYVRMSTEHQQYSTSNQMDVIREYAQRLGLEIVKTYSDEGKSGLNIQGRNSLAQMIQDVLSGAAQFSCILVYDVSRWGRFQDADESAHYEYICRQAGVAVHYCAEQFENNGSPVSTIVKSVKRAMAGEYSRELSSKVFHGARRLILLGFKQGGTAGFGLRRVLVDQNGQKKAELKMGEHKCLQTDRVVLVRGPEEEVAIVQGIYRALLEDGKCESEIAAELNARGVLTDFGRAWTRGTVHQVLTNEKYIGNNVYHRTSFKLKRKHVVNPPETWIRADGVFEGIIEPDLFQKAREVILERSRKFTDDEMLDKLRDFLNQHGRISGILIDEAEGLPSSAAFRHRFGALVSAYRLIGYDPQIDYSFIEVNRRLRKQHAGMVASVIQRIEALGAVAFWNAETELLHLNHELRVSIVVCRHITTGAGSSRWVIRLDAGLKPDITIAVRMDATNEAVRDYYLLPGIDMTWENLRVAEENGVYLDGYRFETLDYFLTLADRIKIQEAA